MYADQEGVKIIPALCDENRQYKPKAWLGIVIAGLLYFDSDYAGASALQLHNPLMSCTSFAPDVQPLFNVNQGIQIPPTHNLLVFFPAYLYHATSVQESTDTRHSLAFNFIPKRCGMTIDDFGTSDSQYDIEWLSS